MSTRLLYLHCQATNVSEERLEHMAREDYMSVEQNEPGYRVEAPRASDAIGSALRDIYARDLGLPDDMAAMLSQLDGPTSH